MKIFVPVVVAAFTFSSASGATEWIDALTPIKNDDAYHMKHVHVVHARVQSDAPVWNETTKTFGSKYYKTAEEQFRGLLDTVNTASVEGALMYVQAEGIDYRVRSEADKCKRKNNMKYVVFYDIVFAQTNETLAEYESEYGPFLAMDGGQCNQVNGTDSEECLSLNGDATLGVANVGPFIGGSEKTTDPRAPYENCWWYSFPNSCPLQPWGSTKTPACRASTRQGLCDMDTLPDGITCTYNYRVLGYVPLDDVVGITIMNNKAESRTYADFSEFCSEGGVEFETGTNGNVIKNIAFWDNPLDTTANTARTQKLLDAYESLLSTKTATQISSEVVDHMVALPTVDDLVAENPPCYENIKECAEAAHGCKRDLYGQICTVCTDDSAGCEKAPEEFAFPTLAKGTVPEASGSSSSATGSSTTDDTTPTPTPTPTPTTASASTTSGATNAALTIGALVASFGLTFLMA